MWALDSLFCGQTELYGVFCPFGRCNVCGKEFFEKALFRRHVKKATHGKKGRVKQNLERECEHCGRKFTQLREYRRHMNNHQGEWGIKHNQILQNGRNNIQSKTQKYKGFLQVLIHAFTEEGLERSKIKAERLDS